MTVKELYDYCKEKGVENREIRIQLKDGDIGNMYCDIGKGNTDISTNPINIIVLM